MPQFLNLISQLPFEISDAAVIVCPEQLSNRPQMMPWKKLQKSYAIRSTKRKLQSVNRSNLICMKYRLKKLQRIMQLQLNWALHDEVLTKHTTFCYQCPSENILHENKPNANRRMVVVLRFESRTLLSFVMSQIFVSPNVELKHDVRSFSLL